MEAEGPHLLRRGPADVVSAVMECLGERGRLVSAATMASPAPAISDPTGTLGAREEKVTMARLRPAEGANVTRVGRHPQIVPVRVSWAGFRQDRRRPATQALVCPDAEASGAVEAKRGREGEAALRFTCGMLT